MATSRPVIPARNHVHWPCRRMIYLRTTATIDRDNGVAFIHLHLLASLGTVSRSRHLRIWHGSTGVAATLPDVKSSCLAETTDQASHSDVTTAYAAILWHARLEEESPRRSTEEEAPQVIVTLRTSLGRTYITQFENSKSDFTCVI